MSDSSNTSRRVAVIGGGITGLAAAHRLTEIAPGAEISLWEAGSRLGGVLETCSVDGFLIERGADNFITNTPWGIDLCRRVGLGDQLLPTNHERRHAFVVCRGRLRKIPEGFVIMAPSRIWPIVATPILSPWGKVRMALEYLLPRGQVEGDETLASFVTRRFGRETYERLVQPLVGGIYTVDPDRLSVQSTMPRFVEMERSHGSLIRACWQQAGQQRRHTQAGSGARYSMFVAPRDGMNSMIAAIAARLPAGCVHLNSPVQRLAPRVPGGWTLTVGGPEAETVNYDCDAVLVATKTNAAARLAEPLDRTLAEQLAGVHHASCSIVSLGYRSEQVGHPLDGFGFVVPQVEHRKVLSGSFASVKYPGRAPDGKVLLRVFIGGALQPELADLPDDQLTAIATEELGQLLHIRGEPLLTLVSRYQESMPQYYVGHRARIEQIVAATARLPGLYFCGNAFDGVGIPFCIHSAEQAAERATKSLGLSNTGDAP